MNFMTLVVMMCQTISPIPAPLCHEVIVAKLEIPLAICLEAPPVDMLIDWKQSSIYSDDKWSVKDIGCFPDSFYIKDQA